MQETRQRAERIANRALAHAASVDIDTAQALLGLAVLAIGVTLALSPAVALIVLGVLLIADAVWSRG